MCLTTHTYLLGRCDGEMFVVLRWYHDWWLWPRSCWCYSDCWLIAPVIDWLSPDCHDTLLLHYWWNLQHICHNFVPCTSKSKIGINLNFNSDFNSCSLKFGTFQNILDPNILIYILMMKFGSHLVHWALSWPKPSYVNQG